MLYALLSLVSCTKEIQRVEEERVPIAISVENIQTKASIFDTPASINNPKVGGGDFALYAFVSGNSSSTGNMYMDHARVNYFPDARRWRFADADGIYFNYFWPLGEHLDFFGHFPLNAEDAGVKVTYTYEDGPSFEYSLPLHSYDESAARNADRVASKTRNQEGLYEFMYSFVPDQSVETQNADPSDPGVKMHFSHPFAAVSFHLDHAYRMTLHEIVLSDIKYKGKYSYDLSAGEWSMSEDDDDVGDLWIEVEKGIPTPINFNSPIGGPYIVAPQDLEDGSNLSVTYTRLDDQKETKHVQLNSLGVDRWEAGKHYVYTLSMGNNNEEILFKVKVDAWDIIDYKNEIDVE